MRRIHLLLATLVPILLTGCASSGMFPSAHLTEVHLAEGNFSVVATNVSGEAQAGYLIGLSAALYTEMRTVALARVSGTGQLYSDAVQDLWRNFEAENGPVAGRRLALVNVRFDSEALNLLVYTRPRVFVRADVVEFEP
jgi:hypothetical protein